MDLDLSIYRNKKICIALSGGGDSMALLYYFFTHADHYNVHLSAVHCEHGIRGASSLKDAEFVKSFCKRLQIPLYLFNANCVAIAKERKISLETAAREFRYQCFASLLQDKTVDLIATAHHQADNAETVLFNLCRGASLTGVSGIPQREGFVRPMLGVTKKEILSYLQQNALPYCHDQTNDDQQITRNALRLRVLPILEETIPAATKNICRFAALAKEDDALLYELATPLLVTLDGGIKITFCDKKPLFYRACLLALKALGVKKDYTLSHMEALYALQSAQNGEKAAMPENIWGIREYDGVVLYTQEDKNTKELPFQFGVFSLAGQTVIITPCEKPEKYGHGYFDYNKIPKNAVLRTRREADVFTKFGGGTKKLKDYLIDKKIPLRERDKLIVLAEGKEILAIVGMEISEKIKVDKGGTIARMTLKKKGD